MTNVVKKDFANRKVTVEISWMDLDHFIKEYDGYAARYLRENNIKEEFRKNKG